MTALFERALGDGWGDLHPKLRERYGVVPGDDREVVGTGEMDRLTRGRLALPALWLGTLDDFVFPEQGADVPFTITTDAFVDDAGREALFLDRRFETDPPRHLVDTLRWNPQRGCITDLYGRRGHVVADLHLRADDGALVLELGRQWLRVRGRYLPQPGALSVAGAIRDWYDDAAGEFHVAIDIRHPLVGRVFACEGQFENELRSADPDAPPRSSLGVVDLPGVDA